jgi:hypothetical protein
MENQNGGQPQGEERKKSTSMGTKITVLVVLIALLAVGILLPIKLVPNAVSNIASTISSFFVAKPSTTVSADKTAINSGDQVSLKWTGSHNTNGAYSLSYECTTGLSLETSVNQPNEPVACGNTYYFTPNDNAIDVVIKANATRFTDAKITLGFLENGASTIDTLGTVTVTVTNPNLPEGLTSSTSTSVSETKPEAQTPETPSQPQTPQTHVVSNPNGLTDLEVRPIATGYINSYGVFVSSNSVSPSDQAAVKFAVVNVGDKNSGVWTFAADLPSQTDPHYVSGPQENLGPGDRIEYILGFKNINNTTDNTVMVNADPGNMLTERSKANNIARIHITNNAGVVSNPSGKADLTIRILDTGVVNRSTGAYTPASSVQSSDRAGVRFEVENIGSAATSAWQFRAQLPTTDVSNINYVSNTQASLNPGEKTTFTIAFENVAARGNNPVTITLDANNTINEPNEVNNTATANVVRN